MEHQFPTKAYVVTVDMGYGHQRAAYPLSDIAARPPSIPSDNHTLIISANNYPGIPKWDKWRWNSGRSVYEKVSRMKKLPIIGRLVFGMLDHFQRIEPFYPKRDMSYPTAQVKQVYRMINRGFGRDLIQKLNQDPLPYITTFFNTAFFAEEHGYSGDIYCLCTDTDVSRAWVPLHPEQSRIKYLAPTRRVQARLQLYGVRKENIFLTGFPLPKENIGGEKAEILRSNLGCRLSNLDPKGIYQKKYQATLDHYLGVKYCRVDSGHKLTITFAVGGAGAQRDIGIQILNSLHSYIDNGDIVLNLVAGSRRDVYDFYAREIHRLHLDRAHGGCVNVVYAESKYEYFKRFNQILKRTDILWTKPSELSFYSALGIPIIMSPGIGVQEKFNRAWLHSIGAGFEQEDAAYTHEWLFDWLNSGWLAQAAMEGFLDAPRNGTYQIENLVLRGKLPDMEDAQLL